MKPWILWLLMGSALTLIGVLQFIPGPDDGPVGEGAASESAVETDTVR